MRKYNPEEAEVLYSRNSAFQVFDSFVDPNGILWLAMKEA